MGALENIISKEGWIGAITTAANGETFAGSARLEVSLDRFGDESEPIVFDIDGTRPVILRRVDIPTADDPRAIRLGIADNRISELNYDPDIELLSAIADEVDISDMYFEDELAALVARDQSEHEDTKYQAPEDQVDRDETERKTLNEKFVVPPFSVLDARQGYWQTRKRMWLELGIQSELGRGDQLIPNGGMSSKARY
jgi:hypothetical protein